MANFMCGCQGGRGEATRLGSKSADAWVKSWETRATIEIIKRDDVDFVSFNVVGIGGGDKFKVEIGNIRLNADEFFTLTQNPKIVKELLEKLRILKELEKPQIN